MSDDIEPRSLRDEFSIVPEKGCWRATRVDGRVSGLFFEQEAAIRFARHEGRVRRPAVAACTNAGKAASSALNRN